MATTFTTALQQQTIAATADNWTRTVSFEQFDPTLGTLSNIRFSIAGTIVATASFENLSPAAATVQLALPGSIYAVSSLAFLGGVAPDPITSVNLGGYDGTTDFRGTSGTVVADLSAVQTSTSIINADSSLVASFSGTGSINLTAVSNVSASVSGNANIRDQLRTDASAVLSLQYDYVASTGSTNTGSGTSDSVSTGYFPVFAVVSIANATTSAPQTVTFSTRTSGWAGDAIVNRFDPSLGTLLAVNINVGNAAFGTFSAENLGSGPLTLNMTETALLAVSAPGIGNTLTATAANLASLSLAAYDGTPEFGGASGRSVVIADAPSRDEPASIYLTDNAALAAFTGTGTIDLPVTTSGTSMMNGPSPNLLSEITQETGGTVTVSYVYDAAPTVPCFAAGTMIATPSGPVAVEALCIGQPVRCLNAGTAAIIWIGFREVDCSRHPKPASVWPIRIRAGAFGRAMPSHDLFLSPDHAMFADGVLIPVRCLVNGTTVAQMPVDRIRYYHVELPAHDVLFAEALPVESFLDTGIRGNFANGGAAITLHPEFSSIVWDASSCFPLMVTGAEVTAVRARLCGGARDVSKPRPAAA